MSWIIHQILMVVMPFLAYHGCNQTESRIMHGNHLRIDEAPWTIGLVSTLSPPDQIEFVLGTGTILSKNYVLTAGHIYLPEK
jgi:secreted trypsin-like serine protease